MSDLKSGIYIILPAAESAPPPFPVGANIEEGPAAPVISAGRSHIWLVSKNENGTYTLILKANGGGKWLSKPGGEDVIVDLMPGRAEWIINKQQDDAYTIEAANHVIPVMRAWTMKSVMPGTRVELGMIMGIPMPGQLWRFIPLPA